MVGIDKNMNKANATDFKDPRVVQLFNRYATYNGSDPYLAPSTLNVIAHPEYNEGGYFLDGGMPDLSRSMHQLATELGVKFSFNSKVEKIELEKGKAKGVWSGYNIKTEAIVNMKEAGIIDPHKVTKNALMNASSIAGTILLTECTIVDTLEDKKETLGDPMMGMM
jgi:phytoene dehydrogenase-like protein